MKPIFIHKYHRLKAKDAEDLFNVMLEEGMTLETMYKHQKMGELRAMKTHINSGKGYNIQDKETKIEYWAIQILFIFKYFN